MVSCLLYLRVQKKAGLLLVNDGSSKLQQAVHLAFCVWEKAYIIPVRAVQWSCASVHLCSPRPHLTPCSSKFTASPILPLLRTGQRKVLLCCRRPGLWAQTLLSHFWLDMNLTAHIQSVAGQREWNVGAMRNMAQIPLPHLTPIYCPLHSTLFQRCCFARLNIIRLHKTLAVCGHCRSACPLGDEFPVNL